MSATVACALAARSPTRAGARPRERERRPCALCSISGLKAITPTAPARRMAIESLRLSAAGAQPHCPHSTITA